VVLGLLSEWEFKCEGRVPFEAAWCVILVPGGVGYKFLN
jgi:hypothetical protein